MLVSKQQLRVALGCSRPGTSARLQPFTCTRSRALQRSQAARTSSTGPATGDGSSRSEGFGSRLVAFIDDLTRGSPEPGAVAPAQPVAAPAARAGAASTQSAQSKPAGASLDETVAAVVAQAEVIAASVTASLSDDPEAAAAVDAQLIQPLQESITSLKQAAQTGAAGLGAVVPQFQERLAATTAEVSRLAVAGDADVAAALDELSVQAAVLTAAVTTQVATLTDGATAEAVALNETVTVGTTTVTEAVVGAVAAAVESADKRSNSSTSSSSSSPATASSNISAFRDSSSSSTDQAVTSGAQRVQDDPAAAAAAAPAQRAALAPSAGSSGSGGSDSSGGSGGSNGPMSDNDRRREALQGLAALAAAVAVASAEEERETAEDVAESAGRAATWLLKAVVGVGALQAFKAGVEAALQQVGLVTLPAAVVSMLAVPALLFVIGQGPAAQLVSLYDSCIAPLTTDLLGLFFVPAVAILPVLLRGLQGSDLAGLLSVAAAGTAASLLLTAAAATAWTSQQPHSEATGTGASATGVPHHSLFDNNNNSKTGPLLLSLTSLAATLPLALTRFDPAGLGASMALPVGVAWSMLGYLAVRVWLQGGRADRTWPSPTLVGALAAKLGVACHGHLMGWSYLAALSGYFAGEAFGAGELLSAPLGAALTALGFEIYKHRSAISLGAIAATAALSAAFSVITSVAAARLLGVSADWARALLPRSVTSSTATDMARAVGAPTECAGLVVLLQAALAILIGKALMRLFFGPKQSPAAAGAAVGATAGVMGVAGMFGGQPVALASGALAYAFMAIIGCVVVQLPAVTAALASVVA